jgi:N-methylhydantoinase A
MEGLPLGDFLGRCDAIVHGTTVADNTLIEMNGALTGLITTAGFRDEMEYRRGFKENIWDVRLPPPPQITPRRRRLTVPERILHDGCRATSRWMKRRCASAAGACASRMWNRWRSRCCSPS